MFNDPTAPYHRVNPSGGGPGVIPARIFGASVSVQDIPFSEPEVEVPGFSLAYPLSG
jgi:hypothetical protein